MWINLESSLSESVQLGAQHLDSNAVISAQHERENYVDNSLSYAFNDIALRPNL